MEAVYKFVPSKLLPSTSLLPWLPHSLVSKIKQHQYLYRKAKETSSPALLKEYTLRNYITSEHRKDSGPLGGGEIEGMGFRGGVEELKHIAK